MILSSKFTHADLLIFPEDGKRREIIEGELFATPAPRVSHQRILRRLAAAFETYLERNSIGEVMYAPMNVILSDYDVLQLDLLSVSNERREILQDWVVRGAPDLVVEILSPPTASRDRGVKVKACARCGVNKYWIGDPSARAIKVYGLNAEGCEVAQSLRQDEAVTLVLVPGFTLPARIVVQS